MLIVARTMEELNFPELMKIYVEGNREHGEELWPEKTKEEQLRLSEQDFFLYLRDTFFKKSGALYMIWAVGSRYVSALRLEPNRDGLLLEALETMPQERRRGYGVTLISAVQEWLQNFGETMIYSHVAKRNEASLKTHKRCGFDIFLEYSVYGDGTRNEKAYTMRCVVGVK